MMKLRHNSPSTIAPGIYPMLYTFFDDQGALRRDPFWVQVDATFDAQAAGVAILGLGTEVSKLTYHERTEVLEVVAKRIDGRKALLVIVYGDTITEQIEFSKRATQSVASALILQLPSQQMDDAKLADFFSEIIVAVDCPIGFQNASEYLGSGLSNQSLIALATKYENFTIAKLECNAVNLQSVAEEMGDNVMLFNGRCGLELTDNLRAGASGLIPALDTIHTIARRKQIFQT